MWGFPFYWLIFGFIFYGRKYLNPDGVDAHVYHYLFTLKQMLAFLANVVNRSYQLRERVYLPDG